MDHRGPQTQCCADIEMKEALVLDGAFDDPAYGGQSEYTPLFLKIHDPLILGFFTRVVWRYPTWQWIRDWT
jgi:hypothetical protein